MNEVLIEFQGTQDTTRADFLRRLHEPLITLAGNRIMANTMIMFFKEIVKNIYDHAGGEGRVSLVETEQGIRFEVTDSGTASYDIDVLVSQGSSKAGNGINYGLGLELIQDMAVDLKIIEFEIKCSKGFAYSGIYPYGL